MSSLAVLLNDSNGLLGKLKNVGRSIHCCLIREEFRGQQSVFDMKRQVNLKLKANRTRVLL